MRSTCDREDAPHTAISRHPQVWWVTEPNARRVWRPTKRPLCAGDSLLSAEEGGIRTLDGRITNGTSGVKTSRSTGCRRRTTSTSPPSARNLLATRSLRPLPSGRFREAAPGVDDRAASSERRRSEARSGIARRAQMKRWRPGRSRRRIRMAGRDLLSPGAVPGAPRPPSRPLVRLNGHVVAEPLKVRRDRCEVGLTPASQPEAVR